MNGDRHKLHIEIDIQEIGNVYFVPIELQDELNKLFREYSDGRKPFIVEQLISTLQNIVDEQARLHPGIVVDGDYLRCRVDNSPTTKYEYNK